MTKNLYLTGEINYDSVSKIVLEILQYQQDKAIKEINLFITSGGGFFYPAFALYDTISASKKPVNTVALGYCASSALVVLQAGKKRIASGNTIFMIHQSSNSLETTSFKEFNTQAEQYQKENEKFIELTTSKSKIKGDFFEKLETSFYFDTQKAVELGLIDKTLA
jgi:ATP-dependent Clp endopeptidase proteolytic subunit ClpP